MKTYVAFMRAGVLSSTTVTSPGGIRTEADVLALHQILAVRCEVPVGQIVVMGWQPLEDS